MSYSLKGRALKLSTLKGAGRYCLICAWLEHTTQIYVTATLVWITTLAWQHTQENSWEIFILPLFTHPCVVSNLPGTQNKAFWRTFQLLLSKSLVSKTTLDPHTLSYYMVKKTNKKNIFFHKIKHESYKFGTADGQVLTQQVFIKELTKMFLKYF